MLLPVELVIIFEIAIIVKGVEDNKGLFFRLLSMLACSPYFLTISMYASKKGTEGKQDSKSNAKIL